MSSLPAYAGRVERIEQRNRATGSSLFMTHPHEQPGAERAAVLAPRFCAGCRKPVAEDPWLSACPTCGDRLLPQGYCPVCEDYWRLPVGTACPKHDLPLDAMAPPGPQFGVGDKPLTWVTVGRFTESLAAEAPRIRLEAEGIPTFVEGQRMGSRSMYHVATGGVRLKVPEDLAAEARIILSQTWSATAAELDLEEEHEDRRQGIPSRAPARLAAQRPIASLRGLPLLRSSQCRA